jgi:uncharacterized protein YjbI with pentapeptide repeats
MPLPESEMNKIEAALPPVEAESGTEEVAPRATLSAQEALAKLRAGEILENVRVVRLTFRGEFPLPVRLKRVVLVQPRFDGATFQGDVQLHGCTLDRPNFERPCTFAQALDLSGSTLVRAQVTRLTVRGKLNCDNVTCRGRFLVRDCQFEGGTRFWDARFLGWAEFHDCTFTTEADFRSFHAEEGFIVKKCRFGGDVLFRGSTVSKKFEANATRFEGLVDFSKAKLHDYVYLEAIEQGDQQRFAFANTLGERIRIRTEQLVGRLRSEEKRDYAEAMHEYAFLKRAFESLHRFDQEDWAYYRFKVNQRRCCGRSWWRPWTKLFQFLDWLVLDLGCGYCTDPFRSVQTAALLILVFAVIYMAGIDSLHLEEPKTPFGGPATQWDNRIAMGLFKSVAVFISGVSGINEMAHGWMNAPLLIESVLGTLLWGLFIVAFSRKVIR